jgi:hypothetical protein
VRSAMSSNVGVGAEERSPALPKAPLIRLKCLTPDVKCQRWRLVFSSYIICVGTPLTHYKLATGISFAYQYP